MDRSELDRCIKEHSIPMATFLGVDDWRVVLMGERPSNPDHSASIVINAPYKYVQLRFDETKIEGEGEAIDSLFHEYAHVLLSEMNLYRTAVVQLVSDYDGGNESQGFRVETMAWEVGIERSVGRLEHVWHRRLRAQYLEFKAKS